MTLEEWYANAITKIRKLQAELESLNQKLAVSEAAREKAEMRLMRGQFDHCCGLSGFGQSLDDICPMCRVQRLESELAEKSKIIESLTKVIETRRANKISD